MKLKNIMNDVRMFRDVGKIIYVGQGESVDASCKARYDTRVFIKVETKKSKESEKSRKTIREVKKDDTSY